MEARSAEDAQRAFYAAFEAGDVHAMGAVWIDSPSALCVHPGSDALRGSAEIRRSWGAILGGGGAGRIEFRTLSSSQDGSTAVFTGYELITPTGASAPFPPVLATNVYRRIGDNWLMVLHHASQIMRVLGPASPDATRH